MQGPKSDADLVEELRRCHHDEAADRLEELTWTPPPPVPHTQEENIAFRKAWDEAYERGLRQREGHA